MRSAQTIITGLIIFLSFIDPVFSHTVKTDAEVGVTFHIEPDHNPQAGKSATAWFVLTRRGGEMISFSECDCQLKVYGQNPQEPILTPSLKAIAAEKYQNIPGAEIIFPQAGIYQLEISGKPKQETDFSPFKLNYEVTVIPGQNLPQTPSREEKPASETKVLPLKWLISGTVIGLLVIWITITKNRQSE